MNTGSFKSNSAWTLSPLGPTEPNTAEQISYYRPLIPLSSVLYSLVSYLSPSTTNNSKYTPRRRFATKHLPHLEIESKSFEIDHSRLGSDQSPYFRVNVVDRYYDIQQEPYVLCTLPVVTPCSALQSPVSAVNHCRGPIGSPPPYS